MNHNIRSPRPGKPCWNKGRHKVATQLIRDSWAKSTEQKFKQKVRIPNIMPQECFPQQKIVFPSTRLGQWPKMLPDTFF